MRKHIALLCVGLAWIAAGALGTTSASAAATDEAEQNLVEQINHVRASHGLRKLELAPSLARSAGCYSESQMSRGYFGHSYRIQASRRYQRVGEILAMHRGARPLVGITVNDWMNSPSHHEVMTSGAYRFIGAGRSVGNFGGGGRTTIWTVQFGG